jgi:hypothetical protein
MPPQLCHADKQLRRGWHPGCARRPRIATAEDIEAAGTGSEEPSDSYWVGFTVGSIVDTVDLLGAPGSVSEEQALSIASTFYERLTAD